MGAATAGHRGQAGGTARERRHFLVVPEGPRRLGSWWLTLFSAADENPHPQRLISSPRNGGVGGTLPSLLATAVLSPLPKKEARASDLHAEAPGFKRRRLGTALRTASQYMGGCGLSDSRLPAEESRHPEASPATPPGPAVTRWPYCWLHHSPKASPTGPWASCSQTVQNRFRRLVWDASQTELRGSFSAGLIRAFNSLTSEAS